MRSAQRIVTRCATACAALAMLPACAHAPARPAAVPARAPARALVSAAAPLDWLPADAFALVHVDVDQLRALLPGALLAGRLQPELHELLERTHGVTVALVAGNDEPLIGGVFAGDYDARINPLLLAKPPRERRPDDGSGRELWSAGHDLWLHTPEGYWVSGEPQVVDALFVPPAQRAQRLSAQPWTAAPSQPFVASGALHVTPPLRSALQQQAEREAYAALVAQVGPALLDLDDVRMTISPDGDGLSLSAGFAFSSELGAQSGALVLRGVLAVLGARVDPDSALARALDAAQIAVTGKELRAQLALDAEQLALLGRAIEAAISDGEQPATVASNAYQPPSAEQLAERERYARAEPTFAKVIDLVIAQAGRDLELQAANHPQTGKPGKPFLLVRVAQQNAPVERAKLAEALGKKGFQVTAVSRGFEGRPAELGVFKARDQAAVLIARGTGEAQKPGSSKQLAALLRGWQARTPLALTVADRNYFAVELAAVPADPDRFVAELLALCPRADAEIEKRQLLEQRMLDCFLD